MRRIIVFGVVTMFFFVLAGCSKPSDAVSDFYDALQEGNYEEAVKYTDVDESSRKDMVAIFYLLQMEIGDYEIKGEKKTSDSTALVTVNVAKVANEEKMHEVTWKTVKKDGKWKIKW